MAKAKKKKSETEEALEQYLAIQLTPAEKAAARARVQEKIDQARAAGVYAWLASLRGTIKPSVSWQELREEND